MSDSERSTLQARATPAMGTSSPHESARAHVAGAATYVDDIAEVKGTLHAAPVLSSVAHGRILAIKSMFLSQHKSKMFYQKLKNFIRTIK